MRIARKMNRCDRWIVLGVVVSAAAGVFGAGVAVKTCIKPGEAAPDFTLSAVRGGVFTLRQAEPHPALIAFLQTIPDTGDTDSRREVALLESMDHQYRARGMRVVIIDASALATGHAPDHDSLLNASYDWNLQTPLLADESGLVAQLYGVTHVPATFLVKADGNVAQVWQRPMAPGELAIAIEKALGSGPLVKP